MTDWFKMTEAGFYCTPGEFHVDPTRGAARAVVSHAHADHYPRYCEEVYGTKETMAIAELRYQKLAAKTSHVREFGLPFMVGPVEVTFYPAGHILGSSQILLEYNGERILYTGDIDFDENPTCRPLVTPPGPIDWLICESTFGEKDSHPKAVEALEACLAEAGKRNLLIATYQLGKAQRIARLMNDHAPEIKLFIDRTITPINKLYKSFGYDVGPHDIYRKQDTKRYDGRYAWLLPPRKITGFRGDRLYHKVFASGWDKHSKAAWLNGKFEVSDHASQSEIADYVLKIKPKAVRFWHGYPSLLIKTCQEAGIDAAELQISE